MKKTNVIDSFRMVRTRRSVSETIVDRIHQMIQENGGRKNNTTKEKDGRANNKRERGVPCLTSFCSRWTLIHHLLLLFFFFLHQVDVFPH